LLLAQSGHPDTLNVPTASRRMLRAGCGSVNAGCGKAGVSRARRSRRLRTYGMASPINLGRCIDGGSSSSLVGNGRVAHSSSRAQTQQGRRSLWWCGRRPCLVPHTRRFLGRQSPGCQTDNEGDENLHRRTVRQGKHSAIALGLKRFNEFHLWFQSMAAKQKRRPRPLGSRGRVFNCARNGRYPYGGRKTAAVPDAS